MAMALAMCGALACSKSRARGTYYVDRITVSEGTLNNNPSLDVDVEGFRKALIRALESSGHFRPVGINEHPPKSVVPFRCRAEVAYTKESEVTGADASGVRAEVAVNLELSRPGSGEMERYEEKGLGTRNFDSENFAQRSPAFRTALDQALSSAISAVLLQLSAKDKTDKELIADLGSPDVHVRDYAVRLLSDRRNSAAVPALIERLSDPDREVALRTIGALRAIGDPRAVPALIEFTRNRDAESLLPAIDAIGAIGGADAEAFLFTLESGHPDETVRQSAAAAAEDLRKRRQHEKQPGPERPKISQETR
jgi:HEAT repeat protein